MNPGIIMGFGADVFMTFFKIVIHKGLLMFYYFPTYIVF